MPPFVPFDRCCRPIDSSSRRSLHAHAADARRMPTGFVQCPSLLSTPPPCSSSWSLADACAGRCTCPPSITAGALFRSLASGVCLPRRSFIFLLDCLQAINWAHSSVLVGLSVTLFSLVPNATPAGFEHGRALHCTVAVSFFRCQVEAGWLCSRCAFLAGMAVVICAGRVGHGNCFYCSRLGIALLRKGGEGKSNFCGIPG